MKVCSQCSAQNPDGAQFCRNCGAQVSAGESPVIVRSQNYSSSAAGGSPGTANIHNADTAVKAGAGNEAKDFFAWLVSALKRPSNPYVTRVWWSFLVMAVTSVLPAFQLIITTNKAFDAYISSYMSSGYRVVGYSPTRPDIPPSVFFKFWLLFAVMLYTAVLLAFIGSCSATPVRSCRCMMQWYNAISPQQSLLCLPFCFRSSAPASFL